MWASDPADDLSARQREVYERLIQGQSPKRIAFELDLSVHTVREHMTTIYKHFGISGRQQLMAQVIRRLTV